ncbi:LysR family transcriptional regulator [Chelatococcus reniformis]|uniref:LysR family transcriptional regulator n=1 Tax=Chelatococcus reniformis TaxID=1494448 RepID=A0A916UBU7_9HYPH|nr:LysR family transcriptional regulator [Chelatococcus reniformis]GGC66515.1 LysR family transcriptional regulator [Chelatococcus reniformis]
MLDTEQLRSFLAIVDTGSFTRAGERVNKTQSAVSMHVRRLEEQLNCELFVKNGRGVRLSADGERLIDYAREMLRVEASALSAIAQRGLSGRVRLGIPDDYAEPFLPDILARFGARHPLVELTVVCEGSLDLAVRINSRDLDLAVVTDCGAIPDVDVVREEDLVWVAAAHGAVARQRPLPLALGNPTCNWRRDTEAALAAAGIPSRMILVSNNYSAIAPMVTAGLAVTVLPRGAVRTGLRILEAADGLPSLPRSRVGIVWSKSARSQEARALAADIAATMAAA